MVITATYTEQTCPFCLVSSFIVNFFLFLSTLFTLFKSDTKDIHTSSPSLDKDLVCDVPDLKISKLNQISKKGKCHNEAGFCPLLIIFQIKCCLNNTSHYLPVCIGL